MKKETKQKIKTQNLEGIFDLNDDPEYLRSCLNSLTELEQNIVKILYYNQKAMTQREIRDGYLNWVFSTFDYISELMEKDKNLSKKFKSFYTGNHTRQNDFFELGFISFYIPPREEIYEIYDEIEKVLDESSSIREKSDRLSKVYSKHHIPIPGFSTITNILKSLKELGFVMERKSIKPKREFTLYFLNPKFNVFLNKMFKRKNQN